MASSTITAIVVLGLMVTLIIGLTIAIRRLTVRGDQAEHEAAKAVSLTVARDKARALAAEKARTDAGALIRFNDNFPDDAA